MARDYRTRVTPKRIIRTANQKLADARKKTQGESVVDEKVAERLVAAMQDKETPDAVARQEFKTKLFNLMNAKGWNQRILAEKAGIASRSSVYSYTSGESLPSPMNLHKICKALGVPPEELLPFYNKAAIRDDVPDMAFTVSAADPERAWLRINKLVTTDTAHKVLRLLHADAKAANGN